MSKSVIMAGWDDVPHLGEQEKKEILEGTPEFLRAARSKGIPYLGEGSIYPIPESEIRVDQFPIKPWFRRVYGMDVGWNATAVVFGALDPDTDVLYLYDCYKRGKAEPEIHASAIRKRYPIDQHLVGVIDPAARNRSQIDGKQLLRLYTKEGLKLRAADNAQEAGIYAVWSRLSTGRLKVFEGVMTPWFEEYRIYRRNEHGKVVKEADHLMDATRYLVHSGMQFAKPILPPHKMSAHSRKYF
jgi:hypothetical protein